MFSWNELSLLSSLGTDYGILVSNGHDVRLWSRLTGHEWVIISPYERGSSCEILHRHSIRDPFHHQKGRYGSLFSALEYIIRHDTWYYEKQKRDKLQSSKKERRKNPGTLRS